MTPAAHNTVGRLDVLVLRLAERCTREVLEPYVGRRVGRPVQLWDGLLGRVAADAVKQFGVPSRPIFALTAAPKKRGRKCTR